MQISSVKIISDKQQSAIPQLLVSVRDVPEAEAAVAGGCHILDIKEPHNGSLGMADEQAITEIVCWMRNQSQSSPATTLPVSAALGEVVDYCHDNYESEHVGAERLNNVPVLPAGLSYCKLGLAGLKSDANWIARWLEVRHAVELKLAHENDKEISQQKPLWIAVAYADWEAANSPAPADVAEAAIATGCAGLLIDTFQKYGRSLVDHLQADELQELAHTVHEHGLLFALAGSLRADNLNKLAGVPTDVIAIRSAACRDGDRTSKVNTAAVQLFQQTLKDVYNHERHEKARK